MLTAGSVLKKERLKRKYSLDEVAVATKIQKHYIEALENNEFSRFPSSVYAKGFIQNYAKFLDTNPGRVLALYRRSVGEAPPQVIKEGPRPIKQPGFVLTPGVILITTAVVVVLATFGYLIYQFYKFQQPPELELTNPSGNITVDEPEITLKGKTEPNMFVTVNDEAVKVRDDGKFEVKLTLSEGTNTIIVKARHPDNIGKEAVITRNIECDTGESSSDDNETTPNDQNPQEQPDEEPQETSGIKMSLSVKLESAWIEVEIDGKQELASIVTPDTTLQFEAMKSVYVKTGKVSTTNIIVNNEEKQFYIGDSGVASILCEIDNSNKLDCHRP